MLVLFYRMDAIINLTINKWDSFERMVTPYLVSFDPALFQNVILGLLALLVPVGVGILSHFFKEKSEKKIEANLDLFILIKRVLRGDKIAIYSVFALLLLAISEVSLFIKIFAILYVVFYIIWLFFVPLRDIWKWFFEVTKDFAVDFLKNLDAKKDGNKMLDSWRALWLGDGEMENEKVFANIFISHVDNALKYRKINLAVELSETYVNNIDKRERFSVGYEILPKVFEWNEILWNKKQLWLETYSWEKKIKEMFNEKYFSTFQKITLYVFKKVYKVEDSFWNWNYFKNIFFKKVIIILLNGDHYQLFTQFKKHINECEDRLNKIEEEKEKKKYEYYIAGIFKVFCTNFFDNINKAQSKYTIWDDDFPNEWKVIGSNFKNNTSKIIFREFLLWSQDRIFKKSENNEHDDDLTEVINGIFPNVHPVYFPDFLMLFFSFSLKDAIDKQLNFFVIASGISWSGEKTSEEIEEMHQQNEVLRREETIDIILKYFSGWKYLRTFKDDLTVDEIAKWKSYSKKEKEKIGIKIKIKKLNSLKNELDSNEIKEYCKESEIKESTRAEFLALIDLLIGKIQKN